MVTLEYPWQMDTITELDTDGEQTLYSVKIGHLGISVSVLYTYDTEDEYFTTDWQSEQPMTMDECACYEWVLGEDIPLT